MSDDRWQHVGQDLDSFGVTDQDTLNEYDQAVLRLRNAHLREFRRLLAKVRRERVSKL